ncbi:hypothetical protein SAMN04488112_12528 [Melghirimyces thermohalophilus]|uniref:Uncharacterized protein n=1 Tax=Melghirimyces thermohalophilus TaxID=1236220 RepID=A0A1G6R0R2_9BACL|nr:hypothetical protein [Melghirimyces thermohalophilus]SDC98260.1 hypothetical protein SAMN04488112_12528 [Melghirimyces thermohalophilus]
MKDDTCYHCEHQVESIHPITFFQQERKELLCDDGYAEWLESIKE